MKEEIYILFNSLARRINSPGDHYGFDRDLLKLYRLCRENMDKFGIEDYYLLSGLICLCKAAQHNYLNKRRYDFTSDIVDPSGIETQVKYQELKLEYQKLTKTA